MDRAATRVTLILGTALLLAACGGGTSGASTTTGVDDASAAPAQSEAAGPSMATPSDAAAQPSEDTTPASADTGTGSTAGGVCDLATPDEVAAIFSVPSVTMEVLAGPPDNCIVTSADGAGLTAWSLMTAQAATVFDALAQPGQADMVDGLGDRAAIVENTGLMILKGDRLVTISIAGDSGLSGADADAVAKALGAKIAGRL